MVSGMVFIIRIVYNRRMMWKDIDECDIGVDTVHAFFSSRCKNLCRQVFADDMKEIMRATRSLESI